jgi:hypothetical protein
MNDHILVKSLQRLSGHRNGQHDRINSLVAHFDLNFFLFSVFHSHDFFQITIKKKNGLGM